MSRTFKGYASAHSARQSQNVAVRRHQQRTLTADFNGAMDNDRTIEAVTWECTHPEVTFLSAPAIAGNQRSASVLVQFNYSGCGAIKGTVTLDNGVVMNYEFYVGVQDVPLYPSATYSSATGPYSVTVSA